MSELRTPVRCDACGAEDTLPRHHVAVGNAFSPEGGLTVVSRHFHCCAQAGCPDGTCRTAIGQGGVLPLAPRQAIVS